MSHFFRALQLWGRGIAVSLRPTDARKSRGKVYPAVRGCDNRGAQQTTPCRSPRRTTFSWTAPARSAAGRRLRSSRTIPPRACDSSTITIPRLRRRRPSRAPSLVRKCTFERRTAFGSKDSKHGWPCCACCHASHGSDASPACHQRAGWALTPTHLSPGTVTAFRVLPRAVTATPARFPGAHPGDAHPRCAWYHIRAVKLPIPCRIDSNLI